MKKLTLALSVLAIIALFAFTTAKQETYKVNTQKSNIEWTGKKVLGSHTGSIKISGGTVVTNGKAPVSGNFTIDMRSMTNKDLDADNGAKLMGHLKSDDFFGVDKYPTAQFMATKITPVDGNTVNITGNLTLKGTTNVVTFPATYAVSGNMLTATAKGVAVDRTKYGIKFGSKSFFESIGDKAINDDFLLDISLVAEK